MDFTDLLKAAFIFFHEFDGTCSPWWYRGNIQAKCNFFSLQLKLVHSNFIGLILGSIYIILPKMILTISGLRFKNVSAYAEPNELRNQTYFSFSKIFNRFFSLISFNLNSSDSHFKFKTSSFINCSLIRRKNYLHAHFKFQLYCIIRMF